MPRNFNQAISYFPVHTVGLRTFHATYFSLDLHFQRAVKYLHELLKLEAAALQMVLHTSRRAHHHIAAASQDVLLGPIGAASVQAHCAEVGRLANVLEVCMHLHSRERMFSQFATYPRQPVDRARVLSLGPHADQCRVGLIVDCSIPFGVEQPAILHHHAEYTDSCCGHA